jgi:hypothetical protein
MRMSLTMKPATAFILGGGGGPLTGSEVKWFFLVVGAGLLVSICWGIIEELIDRFHGRNWPTAPAVIDNVSVAFIKDKFAMYAMDSSYYKATLTYVYRYPEEQAGDYSRRFGRYKKEDAEAWANSYKGETVKVHVDPRDPTRSVLREEDL